MKFVGTKRLALFAALLAASVASTASTTYTTAWYGNPYAYTSLFGCQWVFTGSYGGSWGSQFLYKAGTSCAYKTMQVNHAASAPQATVVLD